MSEDKIKKKKKTKKKQDSGEKKKKRADKVEKVIKPKKPEKIKKAAKIKKAEKPVKQKKLKAPKRLKPERTKIELPKIEFHINPPSMRAKRNMAIGGVIAFLVLCIYIYIHLTYTIDTIIVEGNKHYSDDEIVSMVMGDTIFGKNSIYLSTKYRNKEIKDVPFVETMSVRIVSPTSVRITVYEKAMAGFVEYMGKFIYFDKDGTVIESSDIKTEGIPQIVGMDFDHIVLNEPLPVSDPDIFKQILDVSQLLDKYEIKVDKIYFDKDYNITLYFDEARVKLGSFDSIDEKIIRLKNILPELKGKKGVLRMENYTDETTLTTFEIDN